MFEFRMEPGWAARFGTAIFAALALLGATIAAAPAAAKPVSAAKAAKAGKPAAQAAAAPAACADADVIPNNPAMRQAAAAAVLCLINQVRGQRGLAPVVSSALLAKAAESHASDMVRRKYFSHVAPNGEDFRKRIARTGYLRGARRATLGETLAWGSDRYAMPSQLVADLMSSAEHKAIVLDRRYRDIGVGLALGAPMEDMGSSGSTLSLNFGRR
jgi:uncharacterized protein YkwD